MNRKPVKSSQIKSIGYDKDTNKLEIEFKSGGVYQYDNVTQADYDALHDAESIGSHFYRNIKPHRDKFPFTKIDAEGRRDRSK